MNPQSITLPKLLLLVFTLPLVFMLLLRAFPAVGIAQSTEEREIKNKIPEHLPIKVKIRAEKERAFKDLKDENWVKDFALEVTNTSTKPIYFLELSLIYPELIEPNGRPVGVPLRYGRMDVIDHRTRATVDDLPIKPGETYVYTIPKRDRRGWNARKAKGYVPDPRKVILQFVHLSFGDGTGFNRTDAEPYPYKRKQFLSSGCEDPARIAKAEKNITGFPDIRTAYMSSNTGSIQAGFFTPSIFSSEHSVQSGLCCPGTQCSFLKRLFNWGLPAMDNPGLRSGK
ncbi:MAG TPA: hypothetical protein VJU84_13550 [Pyrinomonadaceae bacterium]|nr:hypothetical protein [Pyrinomonadaceae bacterium]